MIKRQHSFSKTYIYKLSHSVLMFKIYQSPDVDALKKWGNYIITIYTPSALYLAEQNIYCKIKTSKACGN